ncbi:MAG: PQQ-binding-like beta-propeller repeat protein [Pseudomonadota bacterium]
MKTEHALTAPLLSATLLTPGLALPATPEAGGSYDIAAYGGPWATMHRDNKNCACAPYDVADGFTDAYQVSLPSTQVVRATLGPEGELYFPYFDTANANNDKFFAAFNTDDGSNLFTLTEKFTTDNVTAVNVTIDSDGNLYLPANELLSKLTPQGQRLWTLPLRGLARSAQFLPDGNLVLFTWRGWAYVVEPANGAVLSERNLTPLRSYPDTPNCLAAGEKSDCSFINAPAIDPFNALIYNTLIDRAGNSVLHAFQYDLQTHAIDYVWGRRAPRVAGAASSPVLADDYSRVYMHDGVGELFAFDAVTGEELWRFDVGFATGAPPILSDGGYLMVGGNRYDADAYSFVGILQDTGASAAWVLQDSDYSPATTAAAGNNDRFVLAVRDNATDELGLLVASPTDGVVSVSPWGAGGQPPTLNGTTLRDDGMVLIDTWGGTAFKAFSPNTPARRQTGNE